MTLSDQNLIQSLLEGHDQAMALLISRYQQQVRRSLYHLTKGDYALVDDLAQETFIMAYRKLGQFQGTGSFGGWLLKIAYHTFVSHCRKSRHHELLLGDEEEGVSNETPATRNDAMDIEKAMKHLKHEERFAIDLCFSYGYSHSEAAEIMNIPLGTCKSHINRGKEKLRKLLGG